MLTMGSIFIYAFYAMLIFSFDISAEDAHAATYIRLCEGYEVNLRCPGKQIEIVETCYELSFNFTCLIGLTSGTYCSAHIAVKVEMQKLCNLKESCMIDANNITTHHPLNHTSQHLAVGYRCTDIPRNIVVCNGFKTELRCPGQKIRIVNGYFGRNNQVTCSSRDYNASFCEAVLAQAKLTMDCQGKESCVVAAEPSIFGNSCLSNNAYLSIVYNCTDEPFIPVNKPFVSTAPFGMTRDEYIRKFLSETLIGP